jgi:hypothetical protein
VDDSFMVHNTQVLPLQLNHMFLLLALSPALFWQTDEGRFAGTLESMHIGGASHLVLSSTSMAMVAWRTSACRFHSFFSVLPNLCFPHFQKRLHTVYDPNLNKGTCSMSATVFSLIICGASFALQIFFF